MNVYENDYSHSSSIMTKAITFYYGQILPHHIIQNKFSFLMTSQINSVQRQQNLPNVPQTHSIQTIWSLLEQKVYEGAREANNLNQLVDQNVEARMILGVRRKLLQCTKIVFVNIF